MGALYRAIAVCGPRSRCPSDPGPLRDAEVLEQAVLPLPQALDGEAYMGLVQKLRQSGQRAILDLAPAEVEHHPGAILRQRTLEHLTRVAQAKLAPEAQLAAASILEAFDAHGQDLVNSPLPTEALARHVVWEEERPAGCSRPDDDPVPAPAERYAHRRLGRRRPVRAGLHLGHRDRSGLSSRGRFA